MFANIKKSKIFKRIQKSTPYYQLRSLFPMTELTPIEDRESVYSTDVVSIDWPPGIPKPLIGIVQDVGIDPRWAKYRRFLENNHIPFEIYDIDALDWIEKAKKFDIIINIPSGEFFHLQDAREKFTVLEKYLGKFCYPSLNDLLLYEDKKIEAYLCDLYELPMAKTWVSHNKAEALKLIDQIPFPCVHKVDPTAGSIGVSLIKNKQQARRLVMQAFSTRGRWSHIPYLRQKNYVYFQEYIPNDGYDIRVITIGSNWVIGFYRRVLEGDFRASGMDQIEIHPLPMPAIQIARRLHALIKSPILLTDFVKDAESHYHIIEYTPISKCEHPLEIDGVRGVYVFEDENTYHFEAGNYWLQELALREFLMTDYLPFVQNGSPGEIQESVAYGMELMDAWIQRSQQK